MKWIAILLCALAILATTQAIEMQALSMILNVPEEKLQECLKSNELTDDDIEKLHIKNSPEQERLYKEDRSSNFGCFVVCALEKSNIIKNNEIQLDSLVELTQRNKFPITGQVKEKLSECVEQTKEEKDKCKLGTTFALCFLQKLEQ